MKHVLALCLLLASPVHAQPPRWWQVPPEVQSAVREKMAALLNPTAPRRPARETFRFRDRKGVSWLTLVRNGDDIREFNRDGALIAHAWQQGRRVVVVWMDEQGRWHQR